MPFPFRCVLVLFPLLIMARTLPAQAGKISAPPEGSTAAWTETWTDDLDAVIARGVIRVLVPCSKMYSLTDRHSRNGFSDALVGAFVAEVNKELGRPALKAVFVPVAEKDLIPALVQGRGDIVAEEVPIAPGKPAGVEFTVPLRRNTTQVLVCGPAAPEISSLENLSARKVLLQPGSLQARHLTRINVRLAAKGLPPALLLPAPEGFNPEDILEMVNAGMAPCTLTDSVTAALWRRILPKLVVHPLPALRDVGKTAWLVRAHNPLLKARVNLFLSGAADLTAKPDPELERGLKSLVYVINPFTPEHSRSISRFEPAFRNAAAEFRLDPRLLLAQGFLESRLNPKAKGAGGPTGIMQILPATARKLGVGDQSLPENNIRAGAKYLRQLMDKAGAGSDTDTENIMLFALAAYNAGPERIRVLRSQAKQRGLDPDRWFDNVEIVAAEQISRAHVQHVGNVYKYYQAFRMNPGN